jgi:16S rRNA U516 pseudouridylate synthase RsuA-like enzyme
VLTEGVHGEIRALCRRARLQIVKLRREAIGPVELGDLKPRCVRPLRDDELQALHRAVASTHSVAGAAAGARGWALR